jgi:uncharacterized protein (TIGR02246 family)
MLSIFPDEKEKKMRLVRAFVFGFVLLSKPFVSTGATPEDAIKNVLEQQVAAWNRGDLGQFVSSYANHCTLVGSTISETTRQQVLAHYQEKYPTPAARGKLAFSGMAVHAIDARVATVTGHWHLDREAASGGPVGGVFSLVFELLDGSWQIALDHTS